LAAADQAIADAGVRPSQQDATRCRHQTHRLPYD
jgi:hypothetical protein